MKKAIFFLSLLLLFQDDGFPQSKWQIKAGANSSYFVDAENSSSKIGYTFGIARKINIYGDLDITVELDYATKGAILHERTIRPYTTINPMNAYSWDIHGNIGYIELPVLLSYSFPVYEEYSIGLFFGPAFSVPVKDLSEFRKVQFIEEYDPINPSTTDYDYHFAPESGFGNNTISIFYIFGLNISYTNVFIEFRYVLNNREAYYFGDLSDVNYEMNTFQLLLGFSF
jgi:hypothetical protein